MTDFDLVKLRENFKVNFSGLPLEVPKDAKHREILDQIYDSHDWLDKITEKNIRHWAGQTDQGAPLDLRSTLSFDGFFHGLFKYTFKSIFKRKNNTELLHSLIDDFNVIKLIKGTELLNNCSIEDTFGQTETYKINRIKVNTRWLRYIYLASRIKNLNMISGNNIWVDIGSFYGGLQQILYKYFPEAKVVMVDFQHQLFRSYLYLNYSYPDAQHFLNPELTENFQSPGFYYIHPEKIFHYHNLKPDLLTNFFSLGELEREVVSDYLHSNLWEVAKTVYLVNRFVSSPFYEKTFNNDISIIDYISNQNHKIDYLDIFPIHAFLRTKRKFLGINRFRNTSSNYFELILVG